MLKLSWLKNGGSGRWLRPSHQASSEELQKAWFTIFALASMAAVSFPMSPDWAFVVLDAAGGKNAWTVRDAGHGESEAKQG